jgi:hypothetical protein
MSPWPTYRPAPLLTLAVLACTRPTPTPSESEVLDRLSPTTVDLPTSAFHSPASSWWGYNMSKIVRDGDVVLISVVLGDEALQPDADPRANAECHILRSVAGGPFESVAWAPCSRPANLLLGPEGTVNLIAFEATEPEINDSLGSIFHYAYPNAREEDWQTVEKRTVVAHASGEPETANIRVGASITPEGRMAVAFGLSHVVGTGHSAVVLHRFDPAEQTWSGEMFSPVDHEFYYPFVVFGADDAVYSLHVMDDYNDVGGVVFNTYYRADLYRWGETVGERTLVDHTDEAPNFPDRHHLVEQSDLFVDAAGTLHALIKARLHPTNDWANTFVHCQGAFDTMTCAPLESPALDNANWVRLFEIDGVLHALISTWDRHHIVNLATGGSALLDVPVLDGTYPYLAAPRGGTSQGVSTLDIFFVSGASDTYPGAVAHHVSVGHDDIRRVLE